jgi:hypothetical protein
MEYNPVALNEVLAFTYAYSQFLFRRKTVRSATAPDLLGRVV